MKRGPNIRKPRSAAGTARLALNAIFAVTFSMLLGPSAHAGSYSGPMRFVPFEPCKSATYNLYCDHFAILAEGAISSNSARDLEASINAARRQIKFFPEKPAVYFDSAGGNLSGALALGRAIRQLGLNTRLAPAYVNHKTLVEHVPFRNDVLCASACVFAFVGGRIRIVDENARLGVHQFFAQRGAIGDSETQIVIVKLAAYLAEMGIDRRMLDLGSLVRPENLYFLTGAEQRTLRIDNTEPLISKWELKAGPQGDVRAELTRLDEVNGVLQRFGFIKERGKLSVALAQSLAPAISDTSGMNQARRCLVERTLTIGLDASPAYKLEGLTSTFAGEPLVATGILEMTPAQLARLTSARTISFEQDWMGACSRYGLDFTGTFQTDGLREALLAVLRQ